MKSSLHSALKAVVGEAGYLTGRDIGPRYFSDWRGAADFCPDLVLRPAGTEELSRLMKLCNAEDQPVVAQGGMTGLVGGARPQRGEIPISFERMCGIEDLDVASGTVTVRAGTPLQAVQERAERCGLFLPLDLGSRGSCTIGGVLATNAGGNRVLRFGMARDQALGVEAVLADGTVVSSMSGLIKNNAGYDLKQLFIGSEGTLGLITRAVLQLRPRPISQSVAFCAVDDFEAMIALLHMLKGELGSTLSAFEAIWRLAYRVTVDHVPGVRAPIVGDHAFYVLVETLGGDPDRDGAHFERVLGAALESGTVADAVIAQSQADISAFWQVRDGLAEGMKRQQPAVSYDVSLSLGKTHHFCREVERRLTKVWADMVVFVAGHLGDGNLHLVIKAGDREPQPAEAMDDIVYGLISELGGSISAEHGIGLSKRRYLPFSRSPGELQLMRSLKRALDPGNLLGRGRILSPEGFENSR